MDTRKELCSGTKLLLRETDGESTNQYRFQIIETVGRGAGCITYNAKYESHKKEHLVRLKECFPCYGVNLDRDSQNRLFVVQGKKNWQEKKQQFETAYSDNVSLQTKLGLINSSVNVSRLLEGNQTLYMVIEYDEGKDYAQITEETVIDTLTVAKAVSQVLEKYHQSGYLYLDLKPENILILPETKEHIKLLDFDSVISKKQLSKDSLNLSGTKGFSSPEQLRGEVKLIAEQSDIYSLGAVVFAKLMGRKAESKDGAYYAEYHFEALKEKHQNLQPDFFKKLSEFFHQTLSITIGNRFSNMKEVTCSLEELITLADESKPFVRDNFVYHQAVFVGRERELEEIYKCLKEDSLLFLHGIGGIGKSELAKQYAERNRKNYRKILFVSFQNSILETICKEDIFVSHLKREEEESEENYFNRKLHLLQSDLTSDDLFLLDNFDIEMDEHLKSLLKCKCHFLITTREDFSDWSYRQLEIREFEQKETLLELFCSYQWKTEDYQKNDWEAVEKLIKWAKRHTMTIELIAKYLRITGNSPYDYLKKLLSIEGIANSGTEEIKHRKDDNMTKTTVKQHLKAIFDLSDLKEAEKLVLRSLSLFGNTQIQKKLFCQWCKATNETVLKTLSDRGWLIYDEQTEKISLHQIILDLVYEELKPNSQNCPDIMEAMITLINPAGKSRMEQENERRLLKLVEKRIQKDGDERLVRFYLEYDKRFGSEKAHLDFCISYCQKYELFQELSEAYLCYGEMLWNEMLQTSFCTEEEKERKLADEILNLFQKAANVWKKNQNLVAEKIESLLDHSEFFGLEDSVTELFENLAEEYLPEIEDAIERKFFCQENLLDDSFWYEKGSFAEWEGNYQKAILSYKRQLAQEENDLSTLPALARVYEKTGEWQKAIACWQKLKKYDQELSVNIGHDNRELARLYREHNDFQKAMAYCMETIQFQIQRIKEREEKEVKEEIEFDRDGLEEAFLIDAYFEKYQMSGDKKDIDQAIQLYEKQEKLVSSHSTILPFLSAYVEDDAKQNNWEKEAYLLKQTATLWLENEDWQKAENYYQTLYQKAEKLMDQVQMEQALFGLSKVYLQKYGNTQKQKFLNKSWSFCKQAWALTKEETLIPYVEKMRLLDLFGELSNTVSDFEKEEEYKKQCDYYAIAKEDAKGKSKTDAGKIWSDAAEQYEQLEKWEEAIQCLEEIKEFSLPVHTSWKPEFEFLVTNYSNWKRQEVWDLLKLHKREEAKQYLEQIINILWNTTIPQWSDNASRSLAQELKKLSEPYEQLEEKETALRIEILCGLLLLKGKDAFPFQSMSEDKWRELEKIPLLTMGETFFKELNEKKRKGELVKKRLDQMLEQCDRIKKLGETNKIFADLGEQFKTLAKNWREEQILFSD